MIYDIKLTLTHDYAETAGNGRHLVRVLPRAIDQRQWLGGHHLGVLPDPDERHDSVDFFGNACTAISHSDPHSQMQVQMTCRVEVAPPTAPDASTGLGEMAAQIATCRRLGADSPVHFIGPSPRLSPDAAITEFARDLCRPDGSVYDNVIRLGLALHDAMTFDANATTVETDPREAFRLRRGVCQDFTHIMTLALRALDIPAGYVSGFLRTLPPEGGVRLEGADAMHAWVRAWCGEAHGWLEYDPTNATLIGTDHVVVGYGRDYADVCPIIGHLRSSGAQTASQAVDMVAVDARGAG